MKVFFGHPEKFKKGNYSLVYTAVIFQFSSYDYLIKMFECYLYDTIIYLFIIITIPNLIFSNDLVLSHHIVKLEYKLIAVF